MSFIAEPWNSITGLSYFVVGMTGAIYYSRLAIRHGVPMSNLWMHVYSLLCMASLGIATFVFHATLRWEHQVLDKIAIYFMFSGMIVTLYTRCDPKSRLYYLNIAQSIIFAVLFWYNKDDRDGMMIKTLKVIFGIHSVFGAAYIVYWTNTLAKKVGRSCEKVGDQMIMLMLIGLCGWIVDSTLCGLLQTRFPQYSHFNFHGTFWHCGTCFVMHNCSQCTIAYTLTKVVKDIEIEFQTFCHVFSYIVIRDAKGGKTALM